MKVKLVSYTQPVPGTELHDQLNTNNGFLHELIAYCARISNPTNQINTETSEKLLKYMIKHLHWSPFEMVDVCLDITTTRDIARQMLRHWSFSFQEFSQRYSEVEFTDFVLREARVQDAKNRQNSFQTDDTQLQMRWDAKQKESINHSLRAYKWAIENGIAKEQARAVLPEGLTPSRLFMKGNLRSWITYIQTRSGPETQREHRDVCFGCLDAIQEVFPILMDAKLYEMNR